MKSLKDLKQIKGDASFRKFYRNKKNNSIVIFTNIDKNKNLLIYDAINKILIKNKILAPKLLSQNYSNNYIEIQDLGMRTVYQLLKKKKINRYLMFKKIIKILNKIQLIKDKKIKNFKNKIYRIGKYSNKILFQETKLFCDWYIPKKISKKKCNKFNYQFKKEVKILLSKLNCKNNTFVHRDFHVSNIMYEKKKLGVIDSQDALIGNPLYDVASLIDDVRIKLPPILQDKLFNYYYKSSKLKKENIQNLKNDFDILSVQRNLKILGIFVRLHKRDGKSNYLKYLPYVWSLINRRLKNSVFNDFNILINKILPINKLKNLKKI